MDKILFWKRLQIIHCQFYQILNERDQNIPREAETPSSTHSLLGGLGWEHKYSLSVFTTHGFIIWRHVLIVKKSFLTSHLSFRHFYWIFFFRNLISLRCLLKNILWCVWWLYATHYFLSFWRSDRQILTVHRWAVTNRSPSFLLQRQAINYYVSGALF